MKLTHFALAGLFLLLSAGVYLTLKTDMDGRMEQMQANNDRNFQLLEKAMKNQPAAVPQAVEEGTKDVAGTAVKPSSGKLKKGDTSANVEDGRNAVKASAKNLSNDLAGNVRSGIPKPLEKIKGHVNHQLTGPAPSAVDDSLSPGLVNDVRGIADAPPNLVPGEADITNPTGAGAERIAEENAVIAGALEGNGLTKTQKLVLAATRIARVKENKEDREFVVLDHGLNANLAKGDVFSVRRGTAIIGRVIIGDTVLETECVADVDAKKTVEGIVLQEGDEIVKYDR